MSTNDPRAKLPTGFPEAETLELMVCSICGRGPHPCDDPECVPANAPIVHRLEFVVKENENLRLKIRELEDALHSACARVEVERGITKDYRATLGHLEGGAGCQGVKKDFLGCPIATVTDK